MKINRQRIKDLNDWRKDFDDPFYISFIPAWFKFLEWIFVVGAVGYINSLSSNIFITGVYIVSFLFLYMYAYVSVLRSNVWFYFSLNKKWKRIISFFIAFAIGQTAVFVVIKIVEELTKFAP